VKGFFDPSVEFGLQFEQIGVVAAETGAKRMMPCPRPARAAARSQIAQAGQAATHHPAVSAVPTPANPEPAASDDRTDKPADKTGRQIRRRREVVRLDRFRKK